MTEAYQIVYPGKEGEAIRVIEPWVLDPLEYPRPEEGKPVQPSEAAVAPKAPESDCPQGSDCEGLTGVAEGTSTTQLGC
jgi:hypothetical protein